jgi:DNA-directed RNA polymerase subunit RPC12/RpoP
MNHSCFADASGVNEDTSSLICPYCQKKFLVKKIFKRHMAKHTGRWADFINILERNKSALVT